MRRLLAVLIALSPVVMSAQSTVHVGVRGTVHRAASFGDPVGGAVHVEFVGTGRTALRLSAGRAAGEATTFEGCGDPNVNCLPRQVTVATRLTTFELAFPWRLWRRNRLETVLIPEFALHDLNGSRVYGMGLGGEARWRITKASPVELLAGVSVSRLSRVAIEADAERLNRFARVSLGARYRFALRGATTP